MTDLQRDQIAEVECDLGFIGEHLDALSSRLSNTSNGDADAAVADSLSGWITAVSRLLVVVLREAANPAPET